MRGLQHDADATCVEFAHEQIGQFLRHPLLNLRPTSQHLDGSCQLAQADDLAIGQVGDVGLAQEGEQVMLAHRLEADVPDQDHLIVLDRERLLEQFAGVLVQAGEDLGVHASHPCGRLLQALPVGVLADGDQDLTNGSFDARMIHGAGPCLAGPGGLAVGLRPARPVHDLGWQHSLSSHCMRPSERTCGNSWPGATMEGMKILVIVARGLQASLVGAYGNHWVTTAALDALAARGVLFDAHFADAASPEGSRRSWRTARYSFDPHTDYGPNDLLARLRASDVPTMLIHDVSRPLPDAFLQGWSATVEVDPVGEEDPLELALEGAADLLEALRDEANALLWLDLPLLLPPWQVPEDFVAALFEDTLLEPAEEEDEEEEFEEEEADAEEFEEEEEEEEDASDTEWFDDDEVPPEYIADPTPGPNDTEDDRHVLSLRMSCAATVNYLDAGLEQLFQTLDELDPKHEMAVIFTSDHGLPLGEHGVVGLTGAGPHEELLHLPLIVRLPGQVQAGRRVPTLCQPIDLAATLADLLGVVLPEAHGQSLLPLMHGATTAIRPYLLSGVETERGPIRALRTPEWSFILPAPTNEAESVPGRLFLQPEDVWEVNDVRQHHMELAEYFEQVLCEALTASRQPGPLILPELRAEEGL